MDFSQFLQPLPPPLAGAAALAQRWAHAPPGGAVSCWNTPFEVARVESVVRAAERDGGAGGVFGTMRLIVEERGPSGLFAGLLPRCFQAAYQTVFMVCIPRLLESAR